MRISSEATPLQTISTPTADVIVHQPSEVTHAAPTLLPTLLPIAVAPTLATNVSVAVVESKALLPVIGPIQVDEGYGKG